MKKQVNIRCSELTSQQLDQLMEWWGTSKTETITLIIDRLYQEELSKRKELVSNDTRK